MSQLQEQCLHKNIVGFTGPSVEDPAWIIAFGCKDCGVTWGWNHHHTYVPTQDHHTFNEVEYRRYKCTQCPHFTYLPWEGKA